MTTNTDRLGLIKATTPDQFSTADLATNLDTLDAKPGVHLCESTTRPSTWGPDQEGMAIWETDTKLLWHWSGSAWERHLPKNHLRRAARLTDLSTSSTTFVAVVTAAGVSVPAGDRRVLVVATWDSIENTAGMSVCAIYRDSELLKQWNLSGDNAPANAFQESNGGTVTVTDQPGAGSFTYVFMFRASNTYGGTSYARATSNNPISIDLIEV